jgi:hypothetical protein
MLPWISEFRDRLAGETEGRCYYLFASIATASLGFIGEFDKMDSRKKG